jgi:hypothetical protein
MTSSLHRRRIRYVGEPLMPLPDEFPYAVKLIF